MKEKVKRILNEARWPTTTKISLAQHFSNREMMTEFELFSMFLGKDNSVICTTSITNHEFL